MMSKTRVLVSALVAGLISSTAFAAAELTVYTAVEAEDLKKYAARFNEDSPGYHHQVGSGFHRHRDCNKLLAEKDNPQGRRGLGPGGHEPHADE